MAAEFKHVTANNISNVEDLNCSNNLIKPIADALTDSTGALVFLIAKDSGRNAAVISIVINANTNARTKTLKVPLDKA
jgi:hypothetical protein